MVTRILLICTGVLLVAQTRAYAYTDPGSGTLIWQILLGASFGVMFYLRRIIGWVRRLKSRKTEVTLAKAFAEKERKRTGIG